MKEFHCYVCDTAYGKDYYFGTFSSYMQAQEKVLQWIQSRIPTQKIVLTEMEVRNITTVQGYKSDKTNRLFVSYIGNHMFWFHPCKYVR